MESFRRIKPQLGDIPKTHNLSLDKTGWGHYTTYFPFENWEPNHLHWNVPSGIYSMDDGKIYFYAARLSNQRRTGIIDSGRTFYAVVTYLFYKKEGDEKPFYTYDLPVARLAWKDRVDDYEKVWELPMLMPYIMNSYVTVYPSWRHDSSEAPPPVIPFPSIDF